MQEHKGSLVFVKTLINIPDEDKGKDSKNARREIMVRFIGECVVPIYGKNYIKSWCRQKKGHRFLEKMTMSCLGYCLALLKDKCVRCWRSGI